MTQYEWTIVRADAIKRFGDYPRPETEADVLEAFKARPALVVAAIANVAAQVAQGGVRSGWAVLRKRIEDPGPGANFVATDATDRETEIRKAKSWVRNAGVHCDLQEEVEDELFGDRGRLRQFETPQLRTEMVAFWEQERPRGVRAEMAALDWDERCRKSISMMKEYRAKQRTLREQLAPAETEA